MKRIYPVSLAILLALGLGACGPVTLNPVANSVQLDPVHGLQTYPFQPLSGFQIAAVDAADTAAVDSAREAFAADLRAGRLEAYRQSRHFSIQLLAGSEGSYFLSPELIQALNQKVLATLVVILPDQKASIFKGEFENQRFYFADPQQALRLSAPTKAYLLTADSDFSILTTRGQLLPASESPPVAQRDEQTEAPQPASAETEEQTAPDDFEAEEFEAEDAASAVPDAEVEAVSGWAVVEHDAAGPEFFEQELPPPPGLPKLVLMRLKPLPLQAQTHVVRRGVPPVQNRRRLVGAQRSERLAYDGRALQERFHMLRLRGLRVPLPPLEFQP